MMTSFAFILGLLPLVIATGAGAVSRRAVGTPVFAGMLAASVVGIFLIPMLYVSWWGGGGGGRGGGGARGGAQEQGPAGWGARVLG